VSGSGITIVPFKAALAPHFERLNREWIERYFALEPPDLALFASPQAAIVEGGGQIFFALEDGAVLGTCAVIRAGQGAMELAKMAVAPAAQGRGIGQQLGEAAIAFARTAGAARLVLISNSRLTPALALYQRLGFRRTELPPDTGYTRGDVYMTLELAR